MYINILRMSLTEINISYLQFDIISSFELI